MPNRIPALDYIRVLAITAIVWIHTAPGDLPSILDWTWRSLTLTGVPIFFMLSGALILGRFVSGELTWRSLCSFYYKKLPRFVLLLVFWGIVTAAIRAFAVEHLELLVGLRYALGNNGIYNGITCLGCTVGDACHLWYMYEIIFLYILAPFIGWVMGKLSMRQTTLCMFVAMLAFPVLREKCFPLSGFIGTRVCFVLYFMFGYKMLTEPWWRTPKALCGASAIAAGSFMWLLRQHAEGIFVWYSHLSVFLLSCSLCVLLMSFFGKAQRRISVEHISMFSFGIYLSHIAVKLLLTSACSGIGCSGVVRFFGFPLVLLFSCTLTRAMWQNKWLKKLVS